MAASFREVGAGPPLVFLHGGWGYEIYALDRQLPALAARVRIVAPDRTGYGRTATRETTARALEPDFHQRAAEETWRVLEDLGIERPILWGHSDGAVIATLMGLAAPDRLAGLVLEATHLSGRKPASRAFFETIAADPDSVGPRVAPALAHDHGDVWRDVIRRHSVAWLRLADERPPDFDFYDGRLRELRVRTLVVHGAGDPRTEPGELDAIAAAIGEAGRRPGGATGANRVLILPEGGHSPHSERATADAVTQAVIDFL
jgi:pimeloyl-ACP methyl ester carboxylesterase